MLKAEIKRELAPCGLHCGKCCAFDGGSAHRHATGLAEALGDNFAAYAERFGAVHPVFANYGPFRELLDTLAEGSCSGCREGGCLFKTCRVGACATDHKVDFCFECDLFPCDEHGLPERLETLWRRNNERMKHVGVECFFEDVRVKQRYP